MTDTKNNTAPAGWYPEANQPGHERYWTGTEWGTATRQIGAIPSRVAGWYPDAVNPGQERYWNGERWEDAMRLAPSTALRADGKKRRTWPWWVLGGIAAFIVVLVIIVSAASAGSGEKVQLSDDPDTVQGGPSWEDEEEPIEEPVEEPAPPVAKEGSLENPWPLGHVMTIKNLTLNLDQYTVQATVLNSDAAVALIEANMFNDGAPAGMKYVLMQYTITGLSEDKPITPGVEAYNWNLADQNGSLYQQAFVVTPGESISGAPDLYAGQSFVGQAAYLVPIDTTALYFSAYGGFVAI